MRISFLLPFLASFVLMSCQEERVYSDPLEEIIYSSQDALFKAVIDQKDKFEIQILYTQINRDSLGVPTLTYYDFNRDDSLYFYPASTVKMPVSFLALEYINELKQKYPSINEYSAIQFDSVAPPQRPEWIDMCAPTGLPNVAHYIEKVFSVSDNNAYNRLYELVGQDYINDKLIEKGVFRNSRIRTRVGVSGFDTESNKYTNPYRILDENGQVLYEQNELYALYSDFPIVKNTSKGQGYYDDDMDTIIYNPFDMSEKNFINIFDLQQSLERVIFPEIFPESQRFKLTEEQYDFLYRTMTKLPKDFPYLPKDDEHYDSYVKFLIYGDKKDPIPDHIKIANKVGWAYGYLTDCAYIKDTLNGVEFFLTATISVNENGIYNDGQYEFDDIGVPFLAQLGREVYQYELKRK